MYGRAIVTASAILLHADTVSDLVALIELRNFSTRWSNSSTDRYPHGRRHGVKTEDQPTQTNPAIMTP